MLKYQILHRLNRRKVLMGRCSMNGEAFMDRIFISELKINHVRHLMKKNPQSRVIMRKLKALLRRESAFAAFKRNYVREHVKQLPQLVQYIA